MSLNLDQRQRAMLREMGVRVWQPLAPPAMEAMAASAESANAAPHLPQNKPQTPPPLAPDFSASCEPAHAGSVQVCWRVGQAQPLYAQTAQADGARWLVLAQTTPAALQAPAFEGDAGRLLDNMLRAARLHQDAGAVLFAPLVRQAISGPMDELSAALSALVERMQPDVVLVMGRLAAQALLQSSEPLGKLRGQLHALHGRKTVVTYDAPYLLRCPHDKAKAWDDLCLAMRLASRKA
jgi:DNA polymerase